MIKLKNKINNIQQYFIFLYFIVNQLFESQRTKLKTGIGYDLCAYQHKTKYRIQKLFVLLEIGLKPINREDLIVYLKKKNKNFQKKVVKNTIYVNFANKKYIKYLTEFVLWNHCGDFLFQLTRPKIDFEVLQDDLISVLYENIYEYQKIIKKILFQKYGRYVSEQKYYKQKAITQRIKKRRKL